MKPPRGDTDDDPVSAVYSPAVDSDDSETKRIRSVFRSRDQSEPRHPAVEHAYRIVNRDRLDRMRMFIDRAVPGRPTILDVGCGAGHDIEAWLSIGWPPRALAGVDLVDERVREAKRRCPGVDLRVTSGADLPFPDASFDVATAATVFSSIRDERMRTALFAEMCRVVRPGGIVLVYDFVVRKPGNNDVVSMGLGQLRALGAPPTTSFRLTPLLQIVALGTRFGRIGASLALRFAPRTHRITCWRMPDRGSQGA
jgi:SAM-dependent methyltransferase